MDPIMKDYLNPIFHPVAERIRNKADSLKEVKRFKRSGIEGWFKVEVVAALRKKIKNLNNRGPDLTFEDGLQVELKAATDLNPTGIRDGIKYGFPCLFLGDGGDPSRIEAIKKDPKIRVIELEIFSDGENKWVIGMIEPIKKG
jgi:hypothetical protein